MRTHWQLVAASPRLQSAAFGGKGRSCGNGLAHAREGRARFVRPERISRCARRKGAAFGGNGRPRGNGLAEDRPPSAGRAARAGTAPQKIGRLRREGRSCGNGLARAREGAGSLRSPGTDLSLRSAERGRLRREWPPARERPRRRSAAFGGKGRSCGNGLAHAREGRAHCVHPERISRFARRKVGRLRREGPPARERPRSRSGRAGSLRSPGTDLSLRSATTVAARACVTTIGKRLTATAVRAARSRRASSHPFRRAGASRPFPRERRERGRSA
jgi:hypothetical protein